MNSHPYGISELTTAHSNDLLSEGRRRQLARSGSPAPGSSVPKRNRLMPVWATRVRKLALSLVPSALYIRSGDMAKSK
jgi:hypothetical protein